jgi:hypothetical protein
VQAATVRLDAIEANQYNSLWGMTTKMIISGSRAILTLIVTGAGQERVAEPVKKIISISK